MKYKYPEMMNVIAWGIIVILSLYKMSISGDIHFAILAVLGYIIILIKGNDIKWNFKSDGKDETIKEEKKRYY